MDTTDIENQRYDILSKRMNKDSNFREFVINKTNFLESNASNLCRLWHIKNKTYNIPVCLCCGLPTTFSKIVGASKGYNKFCSKSCSMVYINTNRSVQEATARKIKIEQTCLNKYGTKHYFSSEEVKQRKKDTYIARYGVDNPSKLNWVKEKKKNTNLNNLGVENPSQSHTVQSKKSYHSKNKQFVSACGRVFNLEGYEVLGIQDLLKHYPVSDILHHAEIENQIGKIQYTFQNKTSIYHPDFFLKSQNKIIEIKSWYWYNRDIDRNLIKKEACILAGYDFEFWVYNSKSLIKTIL